jgi:NAD+ synthase (glutamine-hydrolysing)
LLSPLFVPFNPRVGDLKGNRQRLQQLLLSADDFPLALLPELALTGYPPRDLLEHEGLAEALDQELQGLAQALKGKGPVLLGELARCASAPGWFNAAWLLHQGRAEVVAQKQLLPDYDVFDEPRYFAPGIPMPVIDVAGLRLGVTICEDLWGGEEAGEGARYSHLPAARLAPDCDLLVNLSASPYQLDKPAQRLSQAQAFARRHDCHVAVVNAVGGNDELIFDGQCFLTDGTKTLGLPLFPQHFSYATEAVQRQEGLSLDRQALVLGLRDYLQKSGCSKVVLGISGGIDSALVAAIAVDALGAENVLGLALPSVYSSDRSFADARALCGNLGMELRELSIKTPHAVLRDSLLQITTVEGLTDENLQARLRGLMVMATANAEGRFALATGNKSELAVGYCTLYGDMCGALAPIGDLFKSDVFAMSALDIRIPKGILEAPPSAELRADQKDEDSLPPYDKLDAILQALIVDKRNPSSLLQEGYCPEQVKLTIALLDRSEFKRRQAAPVLRISAKAFGMGRRHPLAWRRGF